MTKATGISSQRIADLFAASAAAHRGALAQSVEAIQRAADAMRAALARGGKILTFGNGGSALDAQHFAAELVNRFQKDRPALAAVALTTDASILTSVANDLSFERVFSRQIEALGREGDIALGITTSGTSPNVLAAFAAARGAGISTIALLGGRSIEVDIVMTVPDAVTARIQEVHRTILHVLCELIEAE